VKFGFPAENGASTGLVSEYEVVAVPDCEGEELTDARRMLEDEAGLVPVVLHPLAETDDRVRGQSEKPKTLVQVGTAVVLDPVERQVPNLVGMPLADAVKAIAARRFRPEFNRRAPQGLRVTEQDPRANRYQELGKPVSVRSVMPMPDLVRTDASKAAKYVSGQLRLQVRFVETTMPGDLIVQQQPRPRRPIEPGSTKFEVLLAPGPLVPNVINQPLAHADAMLRSKGLSWQKAGETQQIPTTGSSRGEYVLGQSVFPGPILRSRPVLLATAVYVEVIVVEPQPQPRKVQGGMGGMGGGSGFF
jgi:hypothetical protein